MNKKTLPDYILLFLKTPDFLLTGERVMTGSAGQKRLPRQYFESNQFPLSPLAEQSRIVAQVEKLQSLTTSLKARLTAAQTKQAHLAEALIAEVV